MKLLDLVRPAAIVAELTATDRNAAIRELVEVLAASGAIDPALVEGTAKSIVTRERSRGTTGFGKGVAAPHAKIPGLPQVVASVGRSTRGIDWQALDGEPVFGVFLILTPEEQPEEHMRAMDLVYRVMQQEKFRRFLRQSDRAEMIFDLLRETDEQALGG